MAIYEIESEGINPIPQARFSELGLRERSDLQRVIRDRVDVVAPETMVLAEEFGSWEDSRRRIDLLDAVEAKRIDVRPDGLVVVGLVPIVAEGTGDSR